VEGWCKAAAFLRRDVFVVDTVGQRTLLVFGLVYIAGVTNYMYLSHHLFYSLMTTPLVILDNYSPLAQLVLQRHSVYFKSTIIGARACWHWI
jgi:hypothetical protein